MALSESEDTVTGRQENQECEFVLVPRIPIKEMLDAAWADALAEDAIGVWKSMIEAWELAGKHRELP